MKDITVIEFMKLSKEEQEQILSEMGYKLANINSKTLCGKKVGG